jgi:TRAP-type C4-dicarboxylate transport system permease small subunit
MKILKKILGILLLFVSLILIPSTIMSTVDTIQTIPTDESPERSVAIAGCLIFVLIMIGLIYFMIKKP